MTTTLRYELADHDITVKELSLPSGLTQPAAVEARRIAMRALQPMVQRLLPRLGVISFQPAFATVYDAVYAATPAIGGHWAVAARSLGLFSHTIASYSVALAFDDENLPGYFIVSGQREFVTAGVDEAALAQALDEARLAGPLRTSAPHTFLGFGL